MSSIKIGLLLTLETSTALQSQKAVTAYFTSKNVVGYAYFGFPGQSTCIHTAQGPYSRTRYDTS